MPMSDRSSEPGTGPAVALVADLIFASRIRGAASTIGVSAVTVQTAEAVRERVREARPRVILLDLDARSVDVPQLIRELKRRENTEEIPVVAFVSHVRTDAIQAARDAGADRVLARSAFVRELPELLRGTHADDD